MDDQEEHHVDDVSIASSIPTDLSISEISDLRVEQSRKSSGLKSKKQQQKEKDRIARQLLEKKQLEHDLQLMKIELNQREYLLENVRTEYKVKVEELEEKVREYKHQKKILLARTESQISLQQDDAKRRQDRLQSELSVIQVRLRELEAHNDSLMDKSAQVKQQLKEHVDINEDRYYELRGTADENVTVKDLVAMRIFESLRPYKLELDELKIRSERMSNGLTESDRKATAWKQELDEERQQHSMAQVKLTRLITESQDLQAKASSKDYRINNYDRINREREELERTSTELKERSAVLEREFTAMERDKKHYEQEFTSTKSALTLVTQDKDYLTRQVCELTNKLAYADERLQRLTAELDEMKKAREELFEKYVSSRDQYKTQYEQQLQAELKHMSASTQDEVEKLRASTRALYEMESRALKESRDTAVTERDRAVAQEAELQTRYHQLSDQYRQEKSNLDGQLSAIRAEMKMAEYERSRSQLLQDETSKNMKDCQIENEKMLKKLEVANKEYYSLEMRYTKTSTEYESRTKEYQGRLEAYESIEKELDEVIMQAAQVETDEGAERAMLSYGYGASIPSSSQRRMKQSVHLARRCLALERQMVGEKRQMKEMEAAIATLKEQLSVANEKLEATDQPYSYILNKTQELERLNRELRKSNHSMDVDLKSAKKKYQQAAADLQRLTQDLGTSARHTDEISYMKQQLQNVISNSTLIKQTRILNEMSDKERIQRAKRLIEQGTEGGVMEAEHLLQSVNMPCNVASLLRSKEMSAFEAVGYLDAQLLSLSSPQRRQAGRMVGKSHSQPFKPIYRGEHRVEQRVEPDHQPAPAPFTVNRKPSQRIRKPTKKS